MAFGENLNEYMLSGGKRYIHIDTVTYWIDSPRENLVYLRFLKRYNRLSVRMMYIASMENERNDLVDFVGESRVSGEIFF